MEGDGGVAVDAQFATPMGVAADSAGNVYFADTNNHRVRMVAAATGIITTIAGTGEVGPVPSDPLDFDVDKLAEQGVGYSGDGGGPSTEAMLAVPHDVEIDVDGNLLIADTLNARIRKVDLASGTITTVLDGGKVVGERLESDIGTGGRQVTYTYFELPTAMAVTADGVIFVADAKGICVLRFQP